MKVSIIVSLYRTEKHLERFLHDARDLHRSLTTARVPHEFILVANDSTEVERAFLTPLTEPFKVLFVGREPIYASWNRGIRESAGTFVTFWGVDDTRFPQAIIGGIAALEKEPADVAYFPFRYHRFIQILKIPLLAKVKWFIPPVFNKERFTHEMHLGPHFMVRRSIFDTVGYFDESFRIAGDYDWQVRAAYGGAHFTRVLTTSGIFRNDGTTLSGSRAAAHSEENARATQHTNI